MKDYYAILGLDAEASMESIKVAYRRLATQYHPDHLAGVSPEVLARASDRMREINEAYSMLKQRPARQEKPADVEQASAAAVAGQPRTTRVRPDSSVVFSSISGELSDTVRRVLSHSGMKWNEVPWEGFDWSMTSNSLLTTYSVALRGFPMVDVEATRKFTNYATLAMERGSSYKRAHYLFLMAFQRISKVDEINAVCRQFSYGSRSGKAAEVEIGLVDVSNAKSLLCGPKPRDERYGRMLQQLGFSPR